MNTVDPLVLDALEASYDGPSPVNALETHALPNRRAVIEAFEHLQHVLFLGFFTTGRPNRSTLRSVLGRHVEAAAVGLREQVGRATAWSDRSEDEPDRRCEGWCAEAVDTLMAELPSVRQRLLGDAHALYATDPAAESIEEVVFCYPGLMALTAHRLANVLYRSGVPFIPRILTEHAHHRTGIDLHPGATVGERCAIDHGTGVVVGATTVIGDDVRLYQGVTLGALSIRNDVPRDRTAPKRHPTLEDGVTVYAGATILGGDTVVGAQSVIGGNVWLTHSVPPGSKVLYERKS